MGVILNMFEKEKYKVIKAVCNGQMTKERAELKLDLARWTYKTYGAVPPIKFTKLAE